MERFVRENRWMLWGASAAGGCALAAELPPMEAAAVCAALLAVSLGQRRVRAAGVWKCVLVSVMFAGYFWLFDAWHRSALQPLAEAGESVRVEGRIDSPVRRDGDQVRLFLRVDRWGRGAAEQTLPSGERVMVRIKLEREEDVARVEQWQEGDRFRGTLELALPDGARNPYAFDYARYLRWQGVRVTGQADVDTSAVSAEASLSGWVGRWRAAAGRTVDRAFPTPETASYMKSLLLGEAGGVDGELAEAYADLGLIHVLAVSGLHVALVCGLLLRLLESVGMVRERALVVTGMLLAGYVLLVGASPSAVRAGVMGGIGLWAARQRRSVPVQEAWGMALVGMLAVNPYQLWQAGFQLSFAVTLGLIWFVPAFQQLFAPLGKRLGAMAAVTSAAQLVSFPFLVYWFHQASPLSWVVNLVAVPVLSAAALPLGYLALAAAAIHPALAQVPARIAAWVLDGVHAALLRVDQVPVPFRHWPHPHPVWLAAYAAFLLALHAGWCLGYHRPRHVALWGVCLIALLIAARQPFDGADEVRITFLDVGQGDSVVVEVANNTVYLIDGGGTVRFKQDEPWREKRDPFEVGKDVLLPFLRARGIERIDRLVLTHGDQDHIGGLAAVIRRLPVGMAIVNGKEPSAGERQLVRDLQVRGVPVMTGRAGAGWTDAPGVRWTWLYPEQSDDVKGNHASVVLLLDAYGTRVLFTGDMEQEEEAKLLGRGLLPQVDVLKVAHHGSDTSSTEGFLKRVHPQAAVISVGRGNRYGHPSQRVLQRLKEAGTRVFRTDIQGAVTLIVRPEGTAWATQQPAFPDSVEHGSETTGWPAPFW